VDKLATNGQNLNTLSLTENIAKILGGLLFDLPGIVFVYWTSWQNILWLHAACYKRIMLENQMNIIFSRKCYLRLLICALV